MISYADAAKYNYDGDFKRIYSPEKRKAEGDRIITKFPDKIPIIVEQEKNLEQLLDKRKYLVPNDMTVGQLMYVIRKRMKLTADKAIYMFIGGKLFSSNKILLEVYRKHKDEDNFLYATIGAEATFG